MVPQGAADADRSRRYALLDAHVASARSPLLAAHNDTSSSQQQHGNGTYQHHHAQQQPHAPSPSSSAGRETPLSSTKVRVRQWIRL
jgi:hypothetical protein